MFLLSKILGALSQPATLAMAALVAGCPLLFTRRWRLGRALVAAAALAVAVAAVLPLDGWLAGSLENRFPPPDPLPARVDGVIVLGGAIDPRLSQARGRPTIAAAGDRITALAVLSHRYPAARLVYTGGSGDPLDPQAVEAPEAERLLTAMGLDGDRVIFEARSRNTYENAVFSRQLVNPRPGEVWLLVTSAMHMPRAVGVFRAAGWPVVAYPVDYHTPGPGQTAPGLRLDGLWLAAPAIHEWLGLVYYRWRGWTDALLPAP